MSITQFKNSSARFIGVNIQFMSFKHFLLIVFIVVSANLSAQQSIEPFNAENSDGKSVDIPKDLKGKKSILFFAFSERASEMLEPWYEPVYVTFIDQEGLNAMFYDCNIKLLMMFTGSKQHAAGAVKAKVKANADEELLKLLLFYSGDFTEQADALQINKKEDLYVLVLDESGKILLAENGVYTEEKFERIADLVEIQE